jgi:hypothetical protein
MNFASTFIDWADIRQNFPGGTLPIVGGGVLVTGVGCEEMDFEGQRLLVVTAGETYSHHVRPLQHEGSHSTKLLVRCDGSNVRVSGNVGRWGRADNVFNHDLQETVDKASIIVAEKGLPAFTTGHKAMRQSMSKHDIENNVNPWVWTGAHFQELHVTRNLMAGNEAISKEAMRYMTAKRGARLAKGVYGDETLIFGKQHGKLHKRVVVYRKAAEMLAHAKGDEAKAAVKQSQAYQFAQDVGLIRVECKWGRDFLRDNCLRYLGDITMGKIISIFERETDFLLNAEPERVARLVDEMPTKLRSAALHWIRGDDLRQLYSRATYFRHVKALRDYGIDACEPRNVSGRPNTEEALQRMLDALPVFELRPLTVPDWYGLPEVRKAA